MILSIINSKMNKKIKIILAIIIAFFIVIMSRNVYAASASLTAQKTELKPGETTTITASVSATEVWNLKMTCSGGTLSGTTANADSAGEEVSKNVISANFTAAEEGTYTITLTGQVSGSDLIKQEITPKTVTITVKAPVVQTPEPGTQTTQPTTNPEPEKPKVEEKPNFTDVNKTMYASKDMNLRASWSTSSKATSIDKGTELTVTATSNNKVNGYVWYRVSYDGKTLYVASNLLTNTKPEEPSEDPVEQPAEEPKEENPDEVTTVNEDSETAVVKAGLSSLEIEGLTISPAFSPDVYEYRVIVKEDVSELKVDAVPAVEGATVTIAGNQNIKEGENLITIVVYNEKNEVEATYQITTNKSTLDLTETDEMLKIGTKEANRNLIIFILALVMIIIALVVVMILKQKHQNYDENEEEQGNQDMDKFTNIEQTVENSREEDMQSEKIQTEEPDKEDVPNKEIPQNEVEHEEMRIPRRDKRKGKHF